MTKYTLDKILETLSDLQNQLESKLSQKLIAQLTLQLTTEEMKKSWKITEKSFNAMKWNTIMLIIQLKCLVDNGTCQTQIPL